MRLVQKSFVAKGLKTKEGCFSMASRTVKRLGEKLRSWRKRREGSYLPAFWIVAPSARDQDSLPNRGKYASCHLIGFLIGVGVGSSNRPAILIVPPRFIGRTKDASIGANFCHSLSLLLFVLHVSKSFDRGWRIFARCKFRFAPILGENCRGNGYSLDR